MLKCFCGDDLPDVAFFGAMCGKFIQYFIKHRVLSFMLDKIFLRNGLWFEEVIHPPLRKILGIFLLDNLEGKLGFEHRLVEEFLLKRSAGDESVDKYGFLLSDTVRAANCLFFPLRIEVEVEDDNSVRSLKIEAQSTSFRGYEENIEFAFVE